MRNFDRSSAVGDGVGLPGLMLGFAVGLSDFMLMLGFAVGLSDFMLMLGFAVG